ALTAPAGARIIPPRRVPAPPAAPRSPLACRPRPGHNDPRRPAMSAIGVMLNNLERDRHRAWEVVAGLGFPVVHTNALPEACLPEGPWPRPPGPDSDLGRYVAAARASGLRVQAMFVGFDGQSYADPASAARTVGLAVPALRAHRLQVAQAYVGVACDLGAEAL